MLSKISLVGMEFYAHHGCFEEEKLVGTRFKVDVHIFCDVTLAAKTDDLTQTINYQKVHSLVEEVMGKSVDIIETLAYRIIQILKKEFDIIQKVEVTVYKLNPVIGGKTAWAAVTMEE